MTITIATVKENLEHYTHGLPPQAWEFLYDELQTVQNPDAEVLQIFLRSPYMKVLNDPERARREQDYLNALRLKLDGMTKPVSALEKTMSRSQLYSAGNPLWTIGMKPRDIIEILGAVQWSKHYGPNSIPYLFDTIIKPDGLVNYPALNRLYQ